MVGSEVTDLRRLIHIRYGGPCTCMLLFAGVGRQSDFEDADDRLFQERAWYAQDMS
jgi:hypothetical protein